MSGQMNYLFALGEYPPPTIEDKEMNFFVEKEATMLGLKPGAQFKLHVADVPGEAVKGVSSGSAIYHDFYQTHLKGCAGIIFLLDYNSSTAASLRKIMPILKSLKSWFRPLVTSAGLFEPVKSQPHQFLLAVNSLLFFRGIRGMRAKTRGDSHLP